MAGFSISAESIQRDRDVPPIEERTLISREQGYELIRSMSGN
jgi:hypothetical protein